MQRANRKRKAERGVTTGSERHDLWIQRRMMRTKVKPNKKKHNVSRSKNDE